MGSKRLYRSRKNKVLCGVCGGIGEYLVVDPVMIRLIWILLMVFQTWRHLFHVFTGASLIGGSIAIYILAAVIIPKNPDEERD
ncbi:PspC domain-containing protein [Clostridium boliviensis]|uniref:PspC domain-containing protein n=1 Tax=Clostridium boliviensis TaxID=318465 RepID=A0ABU4GN77_9CLOT|nr:PspC domain-containing protein [Clostridium boliviensis]MDW2799067.1 PspC domain-containing protein [Clostridium boliviensis]